jgi:ABC-type multidrug transport system ATPase subunit
MSMEEAARRCDRIAVIAGGAIVATGALARIDGRSMAAPWRCDLAAG